VAGAGEHWAFSSMRPKEKPAEPFACDSTGFNFVTANGPLARGPSAAGLLSIAHPWAAFCWVEADDRTGLSRERNEKRRNSLKCGNKEVWEGQMSSMDDIAIGRQGDERDGAGWSGTRGGGFRRRGLASGVIGRVSASFGTKRSQVQILSPRMFFRRKPLGEIERLFSFVALSYDWKGYSQVTPSATTRTSDC
jgi:hypothetical protein